MDEQKCKSTGEIISCFWLARLVFGTGFGSKKSRKKSSICANQHPFKKPLAHKNSDGSSALEKMMTSYSWLGLQSFSSRLMALRLGFCFPWLVLDFH